MDNHATTPVDPEVVKSMIPYFSESFGNPASKQHQFGWVAEEAVESARASIARLIGAEPREIIFTSGATESNNLAIKGAALRRKGTHVVSVQTEHKSVLDACKSLEKRGYRITLLPVDSSGVLDPERLRDALTPETILVSVMAANNEIGTLQDIASIAALCRERGVLFHSDASQAAGKIPLDARMCDLLSLTAHKIYGPKGAGALYVKHAPGPLPIAPLLDGGGHERGLRSGTLNVPGIVGLARALEICCGKMEEESPRLQGYRDRMISELTSRLDDVLLNGHPTRRLPNNLNLSFSGVEDNALMMSMKDIAVSTGSACSTANPEPSHVLKALKLPAERLHSSLRFGLGRFTTAEEVEYVIGRVVETVQKLRKFSPAYAGRSTVSLS